MAQETWVTMNGTPVKLENGRPTGTVGIRVQFAPKKSINEYTQEAGGDVRKGAIAFYKAELQGKTVPAKIGGKDVEVRFSSHNNNDFSMGLYDKRKAECVPFLPEVIATGEHLGTSRSNHHPEFKQFHHFRKQISLPDGTKRKVIVDVGETVSGEFEYRFYGFQADIGHAYQHKEKRILGNKKGASDSASVGPNKFGPDGNVDSKAPVPNLIFPMEGEVNLYFEDEIMPADHLAVDAKSARTVDENGFLHVAKSHISKETVNPYRGNEIPGWQALGLDPERIYFGYRKGEELKKAAPTFNGLPLLRDHHHESAENPQKEFRIGTLGTSAEYRAPYLDNALVVTDAAAIAEIESGERVELSCSYRYDPVFEPGVFAGTDYDFVMTNIRGNHCALVVEGRAGPDVAVADSAETINKRESNMAKDKAFFRTLASRVLAMDAAPDAKVEEEEVDRAAEIIEKAQGIIDLHEETAEGIMDKPENGDEEPSKKQEATVISDEVKKALDACGFDAESPDFQRGFAEGVRYGERKEKQEPKKLDSEHESEGMKKAMDTDKLVQSASDAAMRRFQAILDAQREVRPVVGEVAVNLASDSAETVYGAALDALGVDKGAHPRAAWRSVFQVLARSRAEAATSTASDAALTDSPLKNIKVL